MGRAARTPVPAQAARPAPGLHRLLCGGRGLRAAPGLRPRAPAALRATAVPRVRGVVGGQERVKATAALLPEPPVRVQVRPAGAVQL
ncbi:hypothetical protein GCM10010343_73240 [Streptomyces avidinii]|nr:hypothetical protein GCM10010343_73240 [Streptomyces avidinii]